MILLMSLAMVGIAIVDARATAETTGAICGLSPTDWRHTSPADPCEKLRIPVKVISHSG
jgi:hypothetical protein